MHLRQSHAQESLRSIVLSCGTPKNKKTKGALEAVCTLTLKSILGLGNTKIVYRKTVTVYVKQHKINSVPS